MREQAHMHTHTHTHAHTQMHTQCAHMHTHAHTCTQIAHLSQLTGLIAHLSQLTGFVTLSQVIRKAWCRHAHTQTHETMYLLSAMREQAHMHAPTHTHMHACTHQHYNREHWYTHIQSGTLVCLLPHTQHVHTSACTHMVMSAVHMSNVLS